MTLTDLVKIEEAKPVSMTQYLIDSMSSHVPVKSTYEIACGYIDKIKEAYTEILSTRIWHSEE